MKLKSAVKVPQDAVEAELAAQGYKPKSPRRTITEDEEEIPLDREQHRSLKVMRGTAAYKALAALFASDEYQKANAEDKRWLIADELREVGEEAREEFLDALDAGQLNAPVRK